MNAFRETNSNGMAACPLDEAAEDDGLAGFLGLQLEVFGRNQTFGQGLAFEFFEVGPDGFDIFVRCFAAHEHRRHHRARLCSLWIQQQLFKILGLKSGDRIRETSDRRPEGFSILQTMAADTGQPCGAEQLTTEFRAMMLLQTADVDLHWRLAFVGLWQQIQQQLRLLFAKVRHPRVHVRSHAAAFAKEDFFKPGAGELATRVVEVRWHVGEFAERLRCGVVAGEIMCPRIFRPAFTIAIMAGVTVQA